MDHREDMSGVGSDVGVCGSQGVDSDVGSVWITRGQVRSRQ